jgi:hypothetical protein
MLLASIFMAGVDQRVLIGPIGATLIAFDIPFLRFLIKNRRVVHDAVVGYATPEGKDPSYFATCECGWFDGPDDRDALFVEAGKHMANVRPDVETKS